MTIKVGVNGALITNSRFDRYCNVITRTTREVSEWTSRQPEERKVLITLQDELRCVYELFCALEDIRSKPNRRKEEAYDEWREVVESLALGDGGSPDTIGARRLA